MAALYPKKTAPFNATTAKLQAKDAHVPGKYITVTPLSILSNGFFFDIKRQSDSNLALNSSKVFPILSD